jgi:hypothetical protein
MKIVILLLSYNIQSGLGTYRYDLTGVDDAAPKKVGAIALVSGSTYVALWTYTGERQALRTRESFLRGARSLSSRCGRV